LPVCKRDAYSKARNLIGTTNEISPIASSNSLGRAIAVLFGQPKRHALSVAGISTLAIRRHVDPNAANYGRPSSLAAVTSAGMMGGPTMTWTTRTSNQLPIARTSVEAVRELESPLATCQSAAARAKIKAGIDEYEKKVSPSS
jgi:hypothetical protein